jgi:antitoxin component HigA of HigAB toxin-antitoxin module
VFIGQINSDSDYQLALKELERLMSAKADSPEGERLDVLVARVKHGSGNIIRSASLPRQPAPA